MEGMIGRDVVFVEDGSTFTGEVIDKVRINVVGSGTNTDYYLVVDAALNIHKVNPMNLKKLKT